MRTRSFLFILPVFCISCTENTAQTPDKPIATLIEEATAQNPYRTVKDIPLPSGYTRVKKQGSTFGAWLENISLKKDRTVYLYDHSLKRNQSAQFAVLDISVGETDLQQCADAVMRLRAEYLYSAKRFTDISFTDNSGTIYLLAQSYMPAQDIHILINPMNDLLSPWYELTENEIIYTPEYSFKPTELKKW